MVGDVVSIIVRCLAGDEKAWKTFVKDFTSMGKNILQHSFELSAPAQEDIIQNVFVKLVGGGLKNFRGASQYEFLKYFKTIVMNEARSHISSEHRRRDTVQLNGELTPKAGKDGEEGLALMDTIHDPYRGSRPDWVIESRDLLEKVFGILGTYPLSDREVFLLKIKGYKDEEVKEILRIPLGTVASKYSRMKARIVEELGEENDKFPGL